MNAMKFETTKTKEARCLKRFMKKRDSIIWFICFHLIFSYKYKSCYVWQTRKKINRQKTMKQNIRNHSWWLLSFHLWKLLYVCASFYHLKAWNETWNENDNFSLIHHWMVLFFFFIIPPKYSIWNVEKNKGVNVHTFFNTKQKKHI